MALLVDQRRIALKSRSNPVKVNVLDLLISDTLSESRYSSIEFWRKSFVSLYEEISNFPVPACIEYCLHAFSFCSFDIHFDDGDR